jgi:hypothetical protein
VANWYEQNLLDKNTHSGAKFALNAMFGWDERSVVKEQKYEIDIDDLYEDK